MTIQEHELALSVQLLQPKEGDLIVLRHKSEDYEFLPAVLDVAKRIAAETKVFVAVIQQGESLELLDEETMRKAGWVRAEKTADAPVVVEGRNG